ncbi:MAG: BamA/TamA family outer membrane protein [Saprospiraceae bacterium]|nr:BamA/TamA family outer membrane protein [Saprospiraceae bacterium]
MNSGYPFCKVYLENFSIEEKNISAQVMVAKGERVFYDSLVIKGDAKISKNFLYRYFQIKPGMVYHHNKVLAINSRIKNILFVKETAKSQVKFLNGQAITYLYLNRAPINRFDFLLGVLPNNNPAEGQSRWTISGDLKAEFYNRFGQGEYIFGQYKKLRPENQEIILKYSMPYIYNFGFGLDSDFRLFRNGNEHIDIIFTGGIQYLYKGLNNIKFGYHYKSSRLIDINRALIQSTGRLPGNLDVVYRSGVVSLQILETDYRFNPSKGILLESKLNIGQKQILENSLISSIPGIENVYENVLKPSLQLESEIDFQYFVPVKTYGAVRLRVLGGIRTGTAEIQQNEFFRIGGNATLRGFDEEGIWTDKFVVFSSEFRLFLDRNSFLSLPFVDFGLTSIVVDNQKILDEAIGLGLGINFSTRAGIFNVSFAAGNRLNSGFDFGNMKVHFGYLNLF